MQKNVLTSVGKDVFSVDPVMIRFQLELNQRVFQAVKATLQRMRIPEDKVQCVIKGSNAYSLL